MNVQSIVAEYSPISIAIGLISLNIQGKEGAVEKCLVGRVRQHVRVLPDHDAMTEDLKNTVTSSSVNVYADLGYENPAVIIKYEPDDSIKHNKNTTEYIFVVFN